MWKVKLNKTFDKQLIIRLNLLKPTIDTQPFIDYSMQWVGKNSYFME